MEVFKNSALNISTRQKLQGQQRIYRYLKTFMTSDPGILEIIQLLIIKLYYFYNFDLR